MTDLNTVTMIGRVVRDVEGCVVVGNTSKLSLSIAVNRSKKDGDKWVDEASFFDVVAWGKQAETLQKYIQKGKQIAVKGSLQQDRWEKDGKKNSKVYIVADQVQLLGGSKEQGEPASVSQVRNAFENMNSIDDCMF